MPEKWKEQAVLLHQEEIADGIYSMWLRTEQMAGAAVPGQFLSIYCRDGSRILPRPLSICEIDEKKEAIRIVYRIVGEGTEEFSHYSNGMRIPVLGPLGNGFTPREKKAFLIGGGIGIPPMLELAKQLRCEKQIILGYRDTCFLADEFQKYGEVFVATEDGSAGTKGTVLDAIQKENLQADMLYACGPTPMLRALKQYAKEHEMEAQISLEEHMACGIGACLACVCRTKEVDEHSNVHNKRICKDGPVFNAEEVEL